MNRSKIDFSTDRIFIWGIIIIVSNFFGFFQYMPLHNRIYPTSYVSICLTMFCAVFLVVEVIIHGGKLKLGKYSGLSMGLAALIIVEVILTYHRYHQPIIYTIIEGWFYIVPLVTYLTFCQLNKRIDSDEFNNILVNAGLICSVIAIIAFCLYSFWEVNILRIPTSNANSFRYGTIRFGVGGIVFILSIIVSLSKIIHKTGSRKDKVNILLGFIHIYFINKTRSLIMYFIMLILVIWILDRVKSTTLKVLLGTLTIVLGIFTFIVSDGAIPTLAELAKSDISIAVRFREMDFYWSQFTASPIFGMGLLGPNKYLPHAELLFGPQGIYYRDDVGVIGLLNKFGILGIVWCFGLLQKVRKQRQYKTNINTLILRNISVFLMVSIINLGFMDPQRVMYVFFLMCISDMISNNSK